MKQCILLFAFLALIRSLTYAQEYASDANTVVLYHFNETSGSDVSDASSNNNNGIASGTTIVDGMFVKARHFTGGSDYVEIPDSPSLDLSTADGLTLEAWIKLDSLPATGYIFNKIGPGGSEDDEWSIAITTEGILQGSINGSSTDTQLPSRSKLNLSNWYHIAYVWNKNTSTSAIYINGALDTITSSVVTSIQNTSIPVRIGKPTHPANSFFGIIDEVRISKKAREPWEFNVNQKLIAYYPFNGNANDESGNGNSGTTNGGVTWDTHRFNNSSATAKFNGVNTDITVNYNPTLFPVEQTISVWVKFNDLTTTPGTNPKILCTADQIAWRGYQLYLLYGGYVRYQDYTPSGYNAVLDFPVNQIDTSKWYHFVILRYTTEAKMYVNGNLVDSITNLVAPNLCQSIGLGIGADIINNREHLNGKIDDIRIYNIALTETEIQRLYENYRQRIRSVTDIPNDQGGKVRITW